jgi:hypothetical protein
MCYDMDPLCTLSLWRRRRRRFDKQKWKNFEKRTLFSVDHVVVSHLSHAVIKVLLPPYRDDIPHPILFPRRMSCVMYPQPPKSSMGKTSIVEDSYPSSSHREQGRSYDRRNGSPWTAIDCPGRIARSPAEAGRPRWPRDWETFHLPM